MAVNILPAWTIYQSHFRASNMKIPEILNTISKVRNILLFFKKSNMLVRKRFREPKMCSAYSVSGTMFIEPIAKRTMTLLVL